MRRLPGPLVIALVVGAAALAGCAARTPGPAEPALRPSATAAALPAMQHTLASGAPWSTATDAAGKLLVIDVWASWCKPCKKGLPRLDRIAAANPDVAVLGLSIDEDDAAMRAFLAAVPVAFPSARVPAETVQAPPLGLRVLPALVVVDRQGRIRWIVEDAQDAAYDALPAVLARLRAE